MGSISISDQAVVNLNGGDYFPKSENSGLKNYTIQGTIAVYDSPKALIR